MDAVFRQIEQGEARALVSIITEIELLGFPRLTRQDETRIKALLSAFTVVAVDGGTDSRLRMPSLRQLL